MNFNEQPNAPGSKAPSILDDVGNQLQLARKLETVYRERPDIGSFVGSMAGTKHEYEYSAHTVERDKEYVKTTRESIEEQNRSNGAEMLNRFENGFQLSEIMQAMVVDRMNKHWYKDTKAIMTSDYDDLRVGIDAVMKRGERGYLGMSFDFTVTSQDKIVYEKLNREWERNVSSGKIARVKYFEDPDTKERGGLLVPKFIIGASKRDVEELAQAYLSGNEEVLENHPFKYVMLLQIEEQLQTVLDYYETQGENETFKFAKAQYEHIQTMLRGMKNEVHIDEEMQKVDLYEHTKKSVALDMMRRFRVMRERK